MGKLRDLKRVQESIDPKDLLLSKAQNDMMFLMMVDIHLKVCGEKLHGHRSEQYDKNVDTLLTRAGFANATEDTDKKE